MSEQGSIDPMDQRGIKRREDPYSVVVGRLVLIALLALVQRKKGTKRPTDIMLSVFCSVLSAPIFFR